MSEPRHEAVLGAAMLGVIKAHGWMQMPIAVDVNRSLEHLRADGGVCMERSQAVAFARGLINVACDVEGWDKPDFGEDEGKVAQLLGVAYDELVKAIECEEAK